MVHACSQPPGETIMRRFAITTVFALVAASADARPQYLKVYKETFREEKEVAVTKCNLCHMGDRKTDHNEYGKQLKAKLPGKNIKDAEVIRKALLELGPYPGRPKTDD
jgi:hypothetical protein